MAAAELVPMVTAGRIMYFQPLKPDAGSNFQRRANNNISNNPCQKFGMAFPIMARVMATLSNMEYCLTADTIPNVNPMITARTMEQDASFREFGNAWAILAATGCLVA